MRNTIHQSVETQHPPTKPMNGRPTRYRNFFGQKSRDGSKNWHACTKYVYQLTTNFLLLEINYNTSYTLQRGFFNNFANFPKNLQIISDFGDLLFVSLSKLISKMLVFKGPIFGYE